MADVPDISIVVPVYGSQAVLKTLYQRVADAVNRIPAGFELIFVDDCGPGHSWEIIHHIAERDPRVIGLRLSKNFGQHHAITAGMDLARGKWIVVMDCDLQDRPEEIPRLWAKAQEGYDVVIGRRAERKDGFFKRFFSEAFHVIFRYVTDRQSDAAQSNFGMYSRRVVDKVKTRSEWPRIIPLLVQRAGFEIVSIDVEHHQRAEGKSGYSFGRKLSLAMDILFSYSSNPLTFLTRFVLFAAVASSVAGLLAFVYCFLFDCTPAGRISLTASLLFFAGILFLGAGVWGIYRVRILSQAKTKPAYVVKERTQMI